MIAGDVLNAIGYRLRPYEKVKGATDEALEEAKKIVYDGARERRSNILDALWQCKPILGAVEVDKTLAEAEGQHHRRVLGDDDRGRRQLPAAALPRAGGRRVRHPARHRVDPLHDLGGAATTPSERADLRERGHREVRPRRRRADGRLPEARDRPRSATWPSARSSRPSRTRRASTATSCRTWRRSPRSAHEYYNNDLRGGEGHMEVGKLILNVVHAEGAHDAQREAVRLHAERRRLRRRAVGSSPRSSPAPSSARSRRAATAA